MKREATLKNSFLGRRAVVVGAGLGGLSAARVLADYFDEVIILDRDELPDDGAPRPGVPQGKHPHRLLGGGLKALENLFPGFGHELLMIPFAVIATETPAIDPANMDLRANRAMTSTSSPTAVGSSVTRSRLL
jgi:hypothetical protein